MNPARSHVAAAHLSEASNALNMRRVLVNAQVTAMISFIEFIFFFGHIMGISLAGGTSPEVVIFILVMYLVLYGVIAPYSFLMNTSYNKNRIIEHGWLNVVKNLTTNSSISNLDILLGFCKQRTNNGSDEVSGERNLKKKDIVTISGNVASIEQKQPHIILSKTSTRKNDGFKAMICVNKNKSISNLDSEANSSIEQIASGENISNDGYNLDFKHQKDSTEIETIYA